MTITAYRIVQGVPFNVSLSMAALAQRNPASAGTSCDGSCAQGHDKIDTLYIISYNVSSVGC